MTYHPKDYAITWDGNKVDTWTYGSGTDWTTTTSTDFMCEGETIYEILEDGPWSPLYEYEDYVGIAHAILAEELGLDEEDIL